MNLGDSIDLVALGLHQKNEIIYFLIREVLSEFGMWIRFLESIGYQSRVVFMYNSLTDISDIASLPASLFSTPVKLSDPLLLNFFSPLRNIFVRLNAKTRAIISEFPFIVLMD